MLRRALTAACLCLPSAINGEPRSLAGQELSALLAGAVIEIDAPLGYKLPVAFGMDGSLAGEARDLAFYLGSPTDTGRWWVKGDQVCHKWKQWLKSEVQCLRLKRDGRTLHWTSRDGETGTARIVQTAATQIALTSPERSATPQPRLSNAASSEKAPQMLRPPEPVARPLAATATLPSATAPEEAETQVAGPPTAAEEPLAQVSQVTPPAAYHPRTAAFPAQRYDQTIFSSDRPKPSPARFVVTNVRPDDVLNVRSGPSAEHEVIAALLPGSRGVAITGDCRSEWCPVQYERASGWVNSSYLASEDAPRLVPAAARTTSSDTRAPTPPPKPFTAYRDPPGTSRTCLTAAARALLQTIEDKFGRVQLVSTCRPGATIAGTGRPSRHASGNAVDFNAGARKGEILRWLIANHKRGGTMTYPNMDHIHVDIGPHFVSIAGGQRTASWRKGSTDPRARSDDDDD